MTTTEIAAPRRRGPYRRRARLQVADAVWSPGDTVLVGKVRWIISTIEPGPKSRAAEREVVLISSNTVNHLIRWRTTLALLPTKPSKETR